ncbi:hypothetical protein [Nonomuraea sp. NPDC049400]|uniref:hypothetical protein n=1 Tax=Nonomuraea sp. NPDC049400 TaxID=3364352 RepID=UPI00378740E1
MSSIAPYPCDRCGLAVIKAYIFGSGGVRIVLDAIPVVGGDFATWPLGYDPDNLRLLAARRPARVNAPYDMPATLKPQFDGYSAANERAWYVEHVHGVSAAEIVERRSS